jgi:hypothetical protein
VNNTRIDEQVSEKPALLSEGVQVLACHATHGTTLHKNHCTHDNAWLRKLHGFVLAGDDDVTVDAWHVKQPSYWT